MYCEIPRNISCSFWWIQGVQHFSGNCHSDIDTYYNAQQYPHTDSVQTQIHLKSQFEFVLETDIAILTRTTTHNSNLTQAAQRTCNCDNSSCSSATTRCNALQHISQRTTVTSQVCGAGTIFTCATYLLQGGEHAQDA